MYFSQHLFPWVCFFVQRRSVNLPASQEEMLLKYHIISCARMAFKGNSANFTTLLGAQIKGKTEVLVTSHRLFLLLLCEFLLCVLGFFLYLLFMFVLFLVRDTKKIITFAKIKFEKNSGMYGIRTHDCCYTSAALLPLELNKPTESGHCVDL